MVSKAPNEPNMRRLPDIAVTEVIGYTNAQGKISELELRGEHAGYEEAPTWLLAFVTDDCTFRISTIPYEDENDQECELTGLDVYVPESLLSEGMPEGITSLTIAHGFHAYVGTVTGTRRAISDFVRTNWTDGSDDADEQLAAWMDLVTVKS